MRWSTNLIEADALVLLTDQRGLYTADPRVDPRATLVRDARAGDPGLETHGRRRRRRAGARRHADQDPRGKTRRALGRIDRDRLRTRRATSCSRLAAGEAIGTMLRADTVTLAARKQWLADHLQLAGQLTLDAGAVRALTRDGKSLLPIGVLAVAGEFDRGEVVGCVDPDGREIARGLVNYSAMETAKILRRPSSEIEGILGYVDEPELIHRDNMVLLA